MMIMSPNLVVQIARRDTRRIWTLFSTLATLISRTSETQKSAMHVRGHFLGVRLSPPHPHALTLLCSVACQCTGELSMVS